MVFGQLIYPNNINHSAGQLEKTHITGSIVHSYATLTFHELFRTKSKNEYCIYINPPQGCVIYNVKARFNDNVTEFVVHKLEEPVSNGYFNSNSNSDAINLNLGIIPSQIIVAIEITCTFTASLLSSNSFEFNIPIQSNLLNTKISTDISISMPGQNLPKIKVSEGSLKFENGNIVIPLFSLKKELKITFEFADSITSSAYSTKIDRFTYMGLSIHPTGLMKNSNIKQEIYLLIDCSGSMSGSKIISARETLTKFLLSLPKNCYFNILRFGSEFEQMFEHSVENNKTNIEKSLDYASMLKANLGGTNIYSPLMSIVNEPPRKGFVRQVFALTDGQVSHEANVIAACASNRHIMRVFPFGIGSDVNFAFIKELAKTTNGTPYFINDSCEISKYVLNALESSQVSAIVNPQIHIQGIDSFEIAPNPIPTLFNDCLTHVIVRYENEKNEGGESILINGDYDDNSYEETISVIKIGNSINFEKLFAYHNIRDMEDKLMNMGKSKESKKIKQNIVRMSIQSAVVSSFTGMFTVVNGVEQKTQKIKSKEQINNVPTNQTSKQKQPQQQYHHIQQCQQPITQKQCWNQCAFAQHAPPIHQVAQPWGRSQHAQQIPQQMMPQPQTRNQYRKQQRNQALYTQQQQLQVQHTQPQQLQVLQTVQPQQIQVPYIQQQQQIQVPYIQPQQLQIPYIQQQQLHDLQTVQQQQQINTTQPHLLNQQKENLSVEQLVNYLLKIQKIDGSWDELSILQKLINTNTNNITINDLLQEFPLVEKEISKLSNECIITLIVIGWIYSQGKFLLSLHKNEIQKGFDYVRSKTNEPINDDILTIYHITDGISWKY